MMTALRRHSIRHARRVKLHSIASLLAPRSTEPHCWSARVGFCEGGRTSLEPVRNFLELAESVVIPWPRARDSQGAVMWTTKNRADRTVTLNQGEVFAVPKGVEHRPVARGEVHILLIERHAKYWRQGHRAAAHPRLRTGPTRSRN
jgi:hypothetical protein